MQLIIEFTGFLDNVRKNAEEFDRVAKQLESVPTIPTLFRKHTTEPGALPRLRSVYCPMCGIYFTESEYLCSVISDERTLWIANMITHYRHNHIESWNKCWGPGGGRYRSGWFGDYDTQKRKVNERAKRQIIRKARAYLHYHKITSKHFEGLQHNDEETLALASIMLG